MKKNATLEWRGRKLMCNGVEIARVRKIVRWWAEFMPAPERNCSDHDRSFATEALARRAINRRFKLKD